MKKVVIIEDNVEYTAALKQLFENQEKYQLLTIFQTGEDYLEQIKDYACDFLIVDIDLPGINGVEVIKRTVKVYPRLKIIVNSVLEGNDTVFQSLKEGAVGYITKTSGLNAMIQALDEADLGGSPMSMKIARMVISSFQKNPSSPLTERETDVLTLLTKGKSYQGIADELFVSKDTVKSHLKNIYIKLQVASKEQAIAKAREDKLC